MKTGDFIVLNQKAHSYNMKESTSLYSKYGWGSVIIASNVPDHFGIYFYPTKDGIQQKKDVIFFSRKYLTICCIQIDEISSLD